MLANRLKWALIVAALALIACAPARADSTYEPCTSITGSGQPCFIPFVTTPVKAPALITPSDTATFTPGTGVSIEVTTPGNIKFGFANGVTWTRYFPATGTYQYNWAVNQVFVTGSTAVFTAWTY